MITSLKHRLFLEPGEEILNEIDACISGFTTGCGKLIITDRRLIFLKKRLFRRKVELLLNLKLSKIKSVEITGFITKSLKLSISDSTIVRVLKIKSDDIYNLASQIVELINLQHQSYKSLSLL